MLLELALGVVAIMGLLYLYLTRHYDYWSKKGVVFIKPNFPLGNVQDQFLGKADTGTVLQRAYTEYKKQGLKYVGNFTLTSPTLMILDLDICKHILTKDFDHFVSREMSPLTHEYISKHLFALEGHEWKEMRTKLTPTFTSGKIKNMFVLMEKCGEQLQQYIEREILHNGKFEVKDLIARFTTDIIATCAFGLEVNSINDRENNFFKVGQLIFVPRRSNYINFFMLRNFPRISKFLNIRFYHPVVPEVLSKIMKDTVQYRADNKVTRNDFVDLLIKVKDNKSLEDSDDKTSKNPVTDGKCSSFQRKEKQDVHGMEKSHLTLEEMTAQAFVFFAAGFETAASTTSFCLYELAKNQEIQDKLRQEIDEVLSNHGGNITYQALQEMTYLDQVINETLRMYASLPLLTRVCTKQYQVPGTDLVLDKGIRISIPIYAIHHDPSIYPDPLRFDPDRFSEENSRDRHHYAFLPFGEGPRICIGMRFGKLQVKMGLVTILSRYQLAPAPGTPSRLEIHPHIVFTTAKHPISLIISKRKDP